jgi:hypothetical protein
MHGVADERAGAEDGGSRQGAYVRQAVGGGDGLVERWWRLGARGERSGMLFPGLDLVCRAAKCE